MKWPYVVSFYHGLRVILSEEVFCNIVYVQQRTNGLAVSFISILDIRSCFFFFPSMDEEIFRIASLQFCMNPEVTSIFKDKNN